MGERLERLKVMLKKEQERRIKLNNRIAILERRIQEESAAEVADPGCTVRSRRRIRQGGYGK